MDFQLFGLPPAFAAKVLGWVLLILAAVEAIVTVYHERFETPRSRKIFILVILSIPFFAYLSLEANRKKDELADKEKLISEEHIKILEAEIATSSHAIAIAKRETEENKKSNLIIQTNLERASAAAAIEKQNVSKMMIEVAEAKRKQAEAEKSLEDMRAKFRPRSLSPSQRVKIIEALSAAPTGIVKIEATSDTEALNYASQFRSLLENAGWTVGRIEPTMMTIPHDGVFIFIKDVKTAPPFAGTLQNALKVAGVEADGKEMAKMQDNAVVLHVGKKP